MILSGIDLLMDQIIKSKYIVALIGAGMSTNAGITDFRGPKGLYNRKDIPADKLFDIEYFRQDPTLFYTYIGELLDSFLNAKPTRGHLLLKKLEDLGKLKMVVSQNIDGLHQKAGIKNIIDIHGNFEKNHCVSCMKEYASDDKFRQIILQFKNKKELPLCPSCGGVLKPDVVFFGEPVKDLELALTEVQKADLLIAIGTSLTVYPVSTLPSYLSDTARLAIINSTDTPYDSKAKIIINEDIDTVAEKLKFN